MKSIFWATMLPKITLRLFEGAAAASGGEGGGEGAASLGETQAISAPTRRGKKSGEYDNVVFGKQGDEVSAPAEADPTPAAAGQEISEVKTTSNTLEDRRKAFRELINGEYKDEYAAESQRMINRRFAETRALEAQVAEAKPVLDMLMQRYGVADGNMKALMTAVENDNGYWETAAEEAGMTVDQYKAVKRMERENAELTRQLQQRANQTAREQQVQKWAQEEQDLKKLYPSFNLQTEVANEQFQRLLRHGLPMKDAFELIHLEDIKTAAAQAAAQVTERQVVSNIRAKGARPSENGTASQSAFTVRDDPSKWSKKDRAEVAKRVARGETIRL